MATKASNIAQAARTVDATGNVDGETLDGLDSSQFLRSDTSDTMTGDLEFTGNGFVKLPAGSTAERPLTAIAGAIRYNTSTGLVEQYNATGWQGIDAPPTVTNFSGVINEDTSSTITVQGSNFKSGSIVYIEGAAVGGGSRALATTYVSSAELTADTNASSVSFTGAQSFNVKVTNPSGLSSTLEPAGTVDRDPSWSTSAGSLGTIGDREGSFSSTVSASDPDGDAITYSVSSGSLPSGITLNSSSGLISGNPNDVSSDTTYPFTINASANTQSEARSFSILVKRTVGLAGDRAVTTLNDLSNYGHTSNGLYYVDIGDGRGGVQRYVDFTMAGGPWVMVAQNMQGESGDSASFGILNTGSPSNGTFGGTTHFNSNIAGAGVAATAYCVRNNNGAYWYTLLDSSSRSAIYSELLDTAGQISNSSAANTSYTSPGGAVYNSSGGLVGSWGPTGSIIEQHHGSWIASNNINYIHEVGRTSRSEGNGGSDSYYGITNQGHTIMFGNGSSDNGSYDYHFIKI
jgi:hypothetical protein